MNRLILIGAAALSLSACDLTGDRVPDNRTPQVNCHVGAWRLADGHIVDLLPVDDLSKMRWRADDGRSGLLSPAGEGRYTSTLGWTGRPDGIEAAFGACGDDNATFGGQAATHLHFDEKDIRFESRGETLYGRLVLPPGTGKVPVAVWVHGSEGHAATIFGQRLHMFPALGIGVFVYDKRGTGHSTGEYTQDFDVLADDAVAAATAARQLAGDRLGRLGFDGGSQGGWIAPLAATRTKVDFVLASYGMAEGPLAEDRDQAQRDVRDAGYDTPDVLAKVREITDATGKVMASDFSEGYTELSRVRDAYDEEPWYPHVRGEYTGDLLENWNVVIWLFGSWTDVGTSWEYDPMPVLSSLDTPMLWVLATEDREAPPDETRRRMTGLVDAGRPIVFAEFPDTDHGMVEFETSQDGTRTRLRQTEGYLRMLADFARDGRLGAAPYGRAQIHTGPGSP